MISLRKIKAISQFVGNAVKVGRQVVVAEWQKI